MYVLWNDYRSTDCVITVDQTCSGTTDHDHLSVTIYWCDISVGVTKTVHQSSCGKLRHDDGNGGTTGMS